MTVRFVMLATLLLELGLPDAPHKDCMRYRAMVPGFIAEVFARHGLDFEGVKPMGSLRRLAFLVEGIPTLTNAVSGWVMGPMERVGRAADGSLTPVALQFLQRNQKQEAELEVREVNGVRRLGLHVERKAVLSATVLPAALPELLEAIDASERNRVGKGVEFARALEWIVALLGDSRVRFKWRDIESDRYTFTSSGKEHRVLVPHFYEYHAVLAQAGIRVDEATRREHLRREMNAVAADFGGRCMLSPDQLEQLSSRLDEPVVHLHRGLPPGLGSAFVRALAFASTFCVAVSRDDGGLAPGWLVVSEKADEPGDDEEGSESEAAHQAFSRAVANAETWLRGRVETKVKRLLLKRVSPFVEFVVDTCGVARADVEAICEAAWYCLEAEHTVAFAEFPGTHLLLAQQRAVNKRASAAVLDMIDGVITLCALPGGETDVGSHSVEADALFLVLVFHDLVLGFSTNQAPLAERDPLALRRRTEAAFEVLVRRGWALPMQLSVERAVAAWGESSSTTATALLGFLRHRAVRHSNRTPLEQPDAELMAARMTGEWSLVGLLAPANTD